MNSVVTIGNFDGLHAGHRRIMRRVVELAQEHDWKPVVLTFDPHPTRVVAPSKSPKLLTTPEQRAAMMMETGIDHVVIMPFTEELARLSPDEFVRQILCDDLDARAVLVGANFRFGAKQAGDVEMLRQLGEEYGFTVEVVDEVKIRGRVVSSTGIRKLIQKGDVSIACRLLQHPYSVSGTIVSGRGVGSKETVPTLNLETRAELLPETGVYITRTFDLDNERKSWDSITNVGFRPTFEDGGGLTVETYLLSPLVAEKPERIRLEFLRRVRPEKKFDSPDALKAQIFKDVGRAKTYFRRLQKQAL